MGQVTAHQIRARLKTYVTSTRLTSLQKTRRKAKVREILREHKTTFNAIWGLSDSDLNVLMAKIDKKCK